MNIKKFRIVILSIITILLLTSCTNQLYPTDYQSSTSDGMDPTNPAQNVDAPLEDATDEERAETAEEVRFTIRADEQLKPAVSQLYDSFFDGESPVFVDDGEDLLVKRWPSAMEKLEFRPTLHAFFMYGAAMIPQTQNEDVEAFVDFSVSLDGQELLFENGELMGPQYAVIDQTETDRLINPPLRRVISAYGPSTAFVYSVGAADRLVSASYLGARDPLGASVMEKIDPRFPDIMGDDYFSQEDFSIEQAAALDPELILTSARTAWLDTAQELGIQIFLYDAETPESLKEAVAKTGELFGPNTSAQASAWIAYYENIIDEIEAKTSIIPEDERPRVLFTGTQPLRVASGEMYQSRIIEYAGGISASGELQGYWNDVNLEQIAIWDPDVIIVPPYGGASVEAIIESEAWQILDAVQEGRVYQMPKLVAPWDTPAPDSVLGIVWLSELLHPNLIELACEQEAEYFYSTFYDYQITQEELDIVCEYD